MKRGSAIVLAIGVVVVALLGGVSVFAQSFNLWASSSRNEKEMYITGLADGIIFLSNEKLDVTRLARYISNCPMTDSDLDRIIRIADNAPYHSQRVAYVITEMARCGGF